MNQSPTTQQLKSQESTPAAFINSRSLTLTEAQRVMEKCVKDLSTPMPMLGHRWRALYQLAETVCNHDRQDNWLSLSDVYHVAQANALQFMGQPVDYMDVQTMLRTAFSLGSLFHIGEYSIRRRKVETAQDSRNTAQNFQYQFTLRPDIQAKLKSLLQNVTVNDLAVSQAPPLTLA